MKLFNGSMAIDYNRNQNVNCKKEKTSILRKRKWISVQNDTDSFSTLCQLLHFYMIHSMMMITYYQN